MKFLKKAIILCSQTSLLLASTQEHPREPCSSGESVSRQLQVKCKKNQVHGKTPANAPGVKHFKYKCGDQKEKTKAINDMMKYFKAVGDQDKPICENKNCPPGKTCGPIGVVIAFGANNLKLDHNKKNDCFYRTIWEKAGAEVIFSPSECRCMDDDKKGGGGSEPHFFTLDNKWWSYHGGCDLVFLRAQLRKTKEDLLIHIRTTIHESFSYISEISVSIGSSLFQVISNDKIQESCKDAKLKYILNGTENVKFPNKISAYSLVASQETDKDDFFGCSEATVFTINLNTKEKIKISYLRGFLYVNVAASSLNFASVTGLIGTWGKIGMVGRDGKTVIDDPVAYAEEWQVRSDEPNLFQKAKHPQHPSKCLPPPSAAVTKRRRLGEESSLRYMAEQACSAIENPIPKEMCIFDVMTMDDPNLASSPLYDAEF